MTLKKTSVDLTPELRARLKTVAQLSGQSQAAIVRMALERYLPVFEERETNKVSSG